MKDAVAGGHRDVVLDAGDAGIRFVRDIDRRHANGAQCCGKGADAVDESPSGRQRRTGSEGDRAAYIGGAQDIAIGIEELICLAVILLAYGGKCSDAVSANHDLDGNIVVKAVVRGIVEIKAHRKSADAVGAADHLPVNAVWRHLIGSSCAALYEN